MGKLIQTHVPNTKEGEGPPLYDRNTQLYPHVAIGTAPARTEQQMIHDQQRGIEFVNYNWALAKTIGLLRNKRLTRDQAIDIMLKAHSLLMLSYAQVYGRVPVLPEIKASGK